MEANYTYAREMAKKVLKKYGANTVPTDLKKICNGYGIEYIEINDADELDGALIEINGLIVAMINLARSSVRGRFTLAHELAHLFLNHEKREYYDAELSRDSDDEHFENSKPAKEREADTFASELLIPLEQLNNYKSMLNDIDGLSKIFQVSKPAMAIAINNFFSKLK